MAKIRTRYASDPTVGVEVANNGVHCGGVESFTNLPGQQGIYERADHGVVTQGPLRGGSRDPIISSSGVALLLGRA